MLTKSKNVKREGQVVNKSVINFEREHSSKEKKLKENDVLKDLNSGFQCPDD
jgi:hypothetical protein